MASHAQRILYRGGPPPARQRGVALLALLAVMIVVGALVLVDHLNNRVAGRVENAQPTADALRLAKEALIAYAVSDSDATTSPGELPCPDFNRDGVITGPADYAGTNCRSRVGWLPWRTLDLPRLQDASGNLLWYVVASPYFARSGAGPGPVLNPDTAGGIEVEGMDTPSGLPEDIVALIIAPGHATSIDPSESCTIGAPAQARPDSKVVTPNATTHVAEYLEAGNADGDDVFQRSGDCYFNDRVLAITQADLMAAVQKRVAAEVAGVLARYRLTHGRFPWLQPFEAPDPAPPLDPNRFNGEFGTTSGQLAFTSTAPAEPGFSFDSGLSVTWTAGDAETSEVVIDKRAEAADGSDSGNEALFTMPAGSATTATSQVSSARDGSASAMIPYPTSPSSGATCWWRGSNDIVDCIGDEVRNAGYNLTVCRQYTSGSFTFNACALRSVQRQVSFTLEFRGTMVASASTDASGGVRARQVNDIDGSMTMVDPADRTIVIVRDTVTLPPSPPFWDDTGIFTITSTLTVEDGDTSTFRVGNLYTEPQFPGTGPTDLPQWFVDNGWAQFVQVAYATGFRPGGGGTCAAGTDCVSVAVNDGAATIADAHAVVTVSGALLGTQGRDQPTPALAGFEEDNADGNALSAERKQATSAFNDQLLVVSCNSGPCR